LPEFRNPNQGGGGSQDNRSFLIMMLVMLGIIFGLQYWHTQHNPQIASPDHPSAISTPATPSASTSTAPAKSAAAPSTAASKASSSVATPTIAAAAETSTVVENELYRITFSNRGGQVTSWILKKYKDPEGHPLDLVHDGASTLYGFPLSLYTYDEGLTTQLSSALYVASATGKLTAPATLTFKYASGNLSVRKTFTFGADYVVKADTEVLRDGAPIRALLAWPAGFGDMDTVSTYASAQVDTNSSGKTEHIAAKKVSGGATLSGPFSFAGVSDQYFAAVFMPAQPDDASLITLNHKIDIDKVKRNKETGATTAAQGSKLLPVLGAAVGALSGHNVERIFVGPKAMDILKSIHTADGNSLEPLLDFGFFGPIGKYLFLGLHAIHTAIAPHETGVHNYSWGWAIILLTLLIYLALMPLRVQGMKSALKMQRIQPEIDAIKAKYKNPKATDAKAGEMNAEIMAMQKANGVSMVGGCIPSLIQLPLLFAFFTMMTRVVELRQAHFFWLPDLSLADPYHILPILMVVTSFLAQFYTPSPGVDPKQQKMMAFMMPLVSGYWTWTYASGLALYWNVGNIVMIVQQLIMNRTSLGREMKDIAAKRARRKAGAPKPGVRAVGSKTIQGRR
jgi:YidC/Oxa1 family membrane protein insertase